MKNDDKTLIEFWDRAFAMSDEDMAEAREQGPEIWREMAPSEKLFSAAASLGCCRRVLDYGSGSGWASIAAAKSGCSDVTAADAAAGAVKAAGFFAEACGVAEKIKTVCVTPGWLASVPDHTYDGFICSNVLDVVMPETAGEILRQTARIVTPDASVIVGLNYWLSPERAAQRDMELTEDGRLYVDGVLRLVSRTDDEWEEIFSPYFTVEQLEHFAWPGETEETRRLFYLKVRSGQ